MVVSSIDIGTNTIRLLIAKLENGCKLDFLVQQSKIARLGEDLSKTGSLKKEAINRALEILKGYIELSKRYGSKRMIASATSAVREAKNQKEFLNAAKNLGLGIRVLSAEQEAKATFLGILYFVKKHVSNKNWTAFDLGGGSTEFMFSCGEKLLNKFSVPIGVVKLLEKHIKHDPPTNDEIQRAKEDFLKELNKFDFPKDTDILVGNAGTVTTLAAIDLSLEKYDYIKTEGYKLTKESIVNTLEKLKKMTSEQRLKTFPILQKGREDVIVIGAEIVKSLIDLFDKDYLLVTNGSLREGILVEEFCNG